MSNLVNMKIRIHNPEHSERVQRALFKLGYAWDGEGKYVCERYALSLFAYHRPYSKYITYNYLKSDLHNHPNKEYWLTTNDELISHDSIPVSTAKNMAVLPHKNVNVTAKSVDQCWIDELVIPYSTVQELALRQLIRDEIKWAFEQLARTHKL